MDNTLRVAKANEIKAIIDRTKPVTEWGMTTNVWTQVNGEHVRVYVNDKTRKCAMIVVIDGDGKLTLQDQPGHSLTRKEIKIALGIA